MLTKVVLSCCALLSAQTALAFSPSITRSRTSSAALYSTSFDGKESSLVVDGRREFLSSSVATLVAGCLTLSTPLTANAKVKSVDYKAVAKDIASITHSSLLFPSFYSSVQPCYSYKKKLFRVLLFKFLNFLKLLSMKFYNLSFNGSYKWS